MAVGYAKNTIPEDAQASFAWRFVEDTFLRKFETLKPNYFQAKTIKTLLIIIKRFDWTHMIEVNVNINKMEELLNQIYAFKAIQILIS